MFASIQGEGYWTGLPATFLRLQGCNLRCPWCDTQEALGHYGGTEPDTDLALKALNTFGLRTIIVTGGEPLMQTDALVELMDLDNGNHRWHLETNGTFPIPERRFTWTTVSPKPPNYVVAAMFADELKIVVDRPEAIGIAWSMSKLPKFKKSIISLQPVDNDFNLAHRCISFLVRRSEQDDSRRWRLSLQIHKFIDVE